MIINRFKVLSQFKCLFVLFWVFTSGICLYAVGEMSVEADDFAAFGKALGACNDSEAIRLGDLTFSRLGKKYRTAAGFGVLRSKLAAAEFLAGRMESQLKKATVRGMFAVADELFDNKRKSKKEYSVLVAPGRSFYETSIKLFSKPVRIEKLGNDEKTFLADYYDLKLRILTSKIAKAGLALAIAEASFSGTHDYVLVLPLLHASDEKAVNIDILPGWMRQPAQLEVFSDSCLLHYGFGFQAMLLARESAQIQQKPFSELRFYTSAARKCGISHPHIAVDCLNRAINYVPNQQPDLIVSLQFEIVQLWLDTGNYALAAGQAHKISDSYPSHKDSGKALWLYYYALSRSNNTSQILTDIDEVLADKRCESYKAKLMYMKWWALRRNRNETARIAALEYELLKKYGDNPMTASVLLSQGTDLLAGLDYNGAYELLTRLLEKFPLTKAADQAKEMIAKLKATKGIK